MLHVRTILSRDGLHLSDVRCRHPAGRGAETAHTGSSALVFVRRGCFVRSAGGVEALLDPTLAYCIRPEDEERYDHPHEHGDECTAIALDLELVASLWGGEPDLPAAPVPAPPDVDIAHRLLLADARRGADPDELVERAVLLAARTLEQADPRRVSAGRPGTLRARRAVVEDARAALVEEPSRSLRELSRLLAVSPHHLSRVFRAGTGHTIARHRMRLRVRLALERLAGGERDLGRLAAELGFADQSHLCRVVREETALTPGALRAALG